MSAPAKTAEEVQAEMEAYSPVTGPAMSPELRARFVAETPSGSPTAWATPPCGPHG